MTQIKKVHEARIARADGKSVVAYVSVFGNVDSQGDRVVAGAFRNSLRRWEKSGDPIPFLWAHAWADPMAHIGVVKRASETERGLLVEAEITDPTPFAEQVNRLLRERRVTQFSFAYDVLDERKAADGANELLELDIIECGPALRGANPQAELVSAKSLLRMFPPEPNDISARVDAIFRNAFRPTVDPAFAPTVDPALANIKARIDAVLGPPPKPVSVEEVKARIDAVMAGKTTQIDQDRVDAFVAQVREERRAEAEAEKQKRERQAARDRSARIAAFLPPGVEQQRDRERAEREAAERERLAAEREAEWLQREQVDQARRAAALENPLIFQYLGQ